jgi:hypothetical protein
MTDIWEHATRAPRPCPVCGFFLISIRLEAVPRLLRDLAAGRDPLARIADPAADAWFCLVCDFSTEIPWDVRLVRAHAAPLPGLESYL